MSGQNETLFELSQPCTFGSHALLPVLDGYYRSRDFTAVRERAVATTEAPPPLTAAVPHSRYDGFRNDSLGAACASQAHHERSKTYDIG
jgi:hypothetical protein